MEELADQYEATVAELKALAKELRIRSAAKLLQAARGRVPGANLRMAQLALETDAGSKCSRQRTEAQGRAQQKDPMSASRQTSSTSVKTHARNNALPYS